MSKPETFPGERVLARACARYATGIRRPFTFRDVSFQIWKAESESRSFPVQHYSLMRDGKVEFAHPVKDLSPLGLLEAINEILVKEVVQA